MRNLMGCVMYWQVARARYMVSPLTQQAWSQVRRSADGWMLSPRCPGAVQGLYQKAVGWISSMGDREAAAQQAQNQKCSVM